MSLETVNFERFHLQSGDRILDLGCGEGRHAITACLVEDVHAVGVDMSLTDLETTRSRFAEFQPRCAGRNLSLTVANGSRLPFANASFDKVICAEVLEHIPDYESVLAEILRVLKPGGTLAVSVPRFGPEWVCWQLSAAYHQVEGGHVRIFKARELQRAIESTSAGDDAHPELRLLDRHWAHGLHSPYWWLRCLFWGRGEDIWPVRLYHQFLVWDLMHKPLLTQFLEHLLNPLIGKSVVMYFNRGVP